MLRNALQRVVACAKNDEHKATGEGLGSPIRFAQFSTFPKVIISNLGMKW